MPLFASTIGTGPYHPAVKYQDVTYVHPDTWDSEDEAAKVASELVDKVHEKTMEEIVCAYFSIIHEEQ